jgi:hypothetical protein
MNLENVLVEVDSDSKTVKIKKNVKPTTLKRSETDDVKILEIVKEKKDSEKQMNIDNMLGENFMFFTYIYTYIYIYIYKYIHIYIYIYI